MAVTADKYLPSGEGHLDLASGTLKNSSIKIVEAEPD